MEFILQSSNTELESRYALLSDELNEAHKALADQERRIAMLEKQLQDLVRWIRDSEISSVGDSQNEPPPPHY